MQQLIQELANDYWLDPNWIAKVIWIESRFNPNALNPSTRAAGLFQFLPSTLQWLGPLPRPDLELGGVPYQFALFRRYLDKFGFTHGKINSQADMYLSVFFPAAVGKPNDYNLQASGVTAAAVARANPAFDFDRNNVITKQEIEAYVQKA